MEVTPDDSSPTVRLSVVTILIGGHRLATKGEQDLEFDQFHVGGDEHSSLLETICI